ncbi:hypothetical protein TIFTF001_023483 [Ficus carica]|uniref:Protein phosphatase n=1 Tax=Ficus carica TaxID=3494 RepID=A0AA88ANK2_FICCA|nr:hypothetical protein TIFTF001_023483 [Ficus carica]
MMNLDEESHTGKSESECVKKNEQRLKMVSASYYIPITKGQQTWVISEAFNGAKGLKGASTACIVALNGCVLDAANVGDSEFMVFRDKKLLYSSPLQQHWFNIPYQLGNQKGADRPGCASELKLRVAAGDILVLGTDGLLDNLFSEEIEMILEKKEEVKPEELAEEIATNAFSKSMKNDCETPFSREYKSLGGQMHLGGKKDDITVIVSHIVNVDN